MTTTSAGKLVHYQKRKTSGRVYSTICTSSQSVAVNPAPMVMSTTPPKNGLLVNWSRVADLNNKKAIASWNHHEAKQEMFERLMKKKSNRNEILRILFPKTLKIWNGLL
jgi:hypothetical protein